MWSRNTIRESLHISSFCGGRRTHTGELTGLLEWPGNLSHSLEKPADLYLQSKITDLILFFQIPCGSMNILFASRIFCLWLDIGTYILPGFFSVICWSYLWTEISVILSTSNTLHFPLSCETTLLILSCDHIESVSSSTALCRQLSLNITLALVRTPKA